MIAVPKFTDKYILRNKLFSECYLGEFLFTNEKWESYQRLIVLSTYSSKFDFFIQSDSSFISFLKNIMLQITIPKLT